MSQKTDKIKIIDLTVQQDAHGSRADIFISCNLPEIASRSQVKNLIIEQNILLNNVPLKKPGQILHKGDVLRIHIPQPKVLNLTPQDLNLEILFEDEHIAVLNKPTGLSVHPSYTEEGPTLVHGLLHALKSLSSVGGTVRPGIVHRIDKGTSGVLVISKTDAAHLDLSAQFKAHSIERKYHALLFGDLSRKGPSGTIKTFFGRHPSQRKKMTGKLKAGRQAITHWKVLKTLGPLTFVECTLETGRTHQIRVHLSEFGYPIVGDPLYGDHERRSKNLQRLHPTLAEALLKLNHQLLHAAALGFQHPVTKKNMRFESLLPQDFKQILDIASLVGSFKKIR